MGVKLRIPRSALLTRFFIHPAGKVTLALLVVLLTGGLATFTYYYVKYSRLIDAKLRSGPFQSTAMIFSAPKTISLGDEMTIEEVVAQLQRSGYTESRTNRLGWYHLREDAVEVFPGPDSYFDSEGGVIRFSGRRVTQIISTRDNTERTQYMLEPELLTNLFDKVKREKRRLIHYPDIPPILVQAVISAEDKRFFQHAGFDPFRILKAIYVDLKEGRRAQGASTLSMQLARMFWLTRDKTWTRKLPEVLITLQLEQKLSKEEIFEFYANEVDLGRRGSFSIRGLGEGAQAFFGKDVRDLTLPEAATLAGTIQRPSPTSPVRWPERARTRRNVVLGMMRDNGYITDEQYRQAAASPMDVVRGGAESADAPYFVDLVNEKLQDEFEEADLQNRSYRIYTTLDMDLQREAAEAVRIGMQEVDDQLKQQRAFRKGRAPDEQVALIALEATTGEVRALIGGRDYGRSQLNRTEALRQPGSVFKPFVYAAALSSSLETSDRPITSLATVVDEPTTFWFDEKPYEPSNYKQDYEGVVTLRRALAKSLNVPAVKVAEMAGYGRVVEVARRSGMNRNIQPTPAVALGAYEVTPLEIAGAYTVFANRGEYVEPNWLKLVRDDGGKILRAYKPSRHQAIDPQVSYLMVDLLEDVVRSGTGQGVRARGFTLPVAGKTGTSHDGWFAGFTSRLICIVWVGFDDNRELNLEGARSALPIWTEFMKRAHKLREYRNVRAFEPPDGIVMVTIDPATGLLATAGCPGAVQQPFIAGTQPVEFCRLHGGAAAGATQVAGWELPAEQSSTKKASGEGSASGSARRRAPEATGTAAVSAQAPAKQPAAPRKSIFRRLLDVFK